MNIWEPHCRIARHRGLAICCITKNANTAIKRAILRAQDIDPDGLRVDRHPALNMGPEVTGYFVAAFIRDPVDRAYSLWCEKIARDAGRASHYLYRLGFRQDMSFAEFVRHIPTRRMRDIHLRAQADFIPETGAAFLGRFANLGEDWAALQGRFAWLPDLERVNAVSDGDWKAHCEADTAEIIAREYPADHWLYHRANELRAAA